MPGERHLVIQKIWDWRRMPMAAHFRREDCPSTELDLEVYGRTTETVS